MPAWQLIYRQALFLILIHPRAAPAFGTESGELRLRFLIPQLVLVALKGIYFLFVQKLCSFLNRDSHFRGNKLYSAERIYKYKLNNTVSG